MSQHLPIAFISTYPPEHCGVGKSAFDLVQQVRKRRSIAVVANVVPGAPSSTPDVLRKWRKRSLRFPLDGALGARQLVPRGPAIAQVNHHFFLYGGVLSNLEFPLLLLLLRLRGFRVAVELHSVIDPRRLSDGAASGFAEARLPAARLGLTAFYRVVAVLADVVFAPGASSRRTLVESYGIREDRVVAVSPGWDLPLIETSARAPSRNPGEFTVLFHGFLDRTKGLEVLLDAFAGVHRHLPNARLVLAGEPGPDLRGGGPAFLDELRKRAAELGVGDRVKFTGYLSESALLEALQSADVIALPYTMTLSLGGSAVLTRVASLGVPIVASRISRFSDELVDDRDALLVTPGDPRALEAALTRLAVDPELRTRLGEKLRSSALSRGWDSTAATMEREIYERLDALPHRGS